MPSIFSRIVAGEIPCHKLAESEAYLAFLDINPVSRGHALVIPKMEVDYLFDLPKDLLSGILEFARPIARAIEQVVPCERIGVTVIGLEVPHAHVHLIPINAIGDMDFSKPKVPMTQDELGQLASRVRDILSV